MDPCLYPNMELRSLIRSLSWSEAAACVVELIRFFRVRFGDRPFIVFNMYIAYERGLNEGLRR